MHCKFLLCTCEKNHLKFANLHTVKLCDPDKFYTFYSALISKRIIFEVCLSKKDGISFCFGVV